MLTDGIAEAYDKGGEAISAASGVETLIRSTQTGKARSRACALQGRSQRLHRKPGAVP